MKKVVTLVLAFVFAVSMAGCAQTVHVDFPFDPADLDFIEMFHFYTPAEAEKKVITEQADMKDLYDRLEGISLKDKKTEPVAGGSVTSFRFHCADGTTYEVIYSSIAVKSGRIKMTGDETDYFTSADLAACWSNYAYEAVTAGENEFPALYGK